MDTTNSTVPTTRVKKAKVINSIRRKWKQNEENILMGLLKELLASGGWKSENGFRPGYLQKLEEKMREKLPGTDLRASPHINSKITSWKRHHGAIQLALGDSGGGFNTETKILDVSDIAWGKAVAKESTIQSMRYKPWPFYFDWEWFTQNTYNEWFSAKKQKKDFNWLEDAGKIVDYVSGRYPLFGVGLDWGDAEIVYGIAHINQNHWVLYEIRLKVQEIMIYDSLSCKRMNLKATTSFRQIAVLMSIVYTQLLGNSPESCPKKEWKFNLCSYCPQKTDGDSCGIIASKVFECLVASRSIEDINPDDSDEYRKSYCLELFDANNIIL